MNHLLFEFVRSQNPQLLEKYVERYLTDDPEDLQRIYREIQDLKVHEKREKPQEETKKLLKKRLSYLEKNTAEYKIRQSQHLLMKLRDSGITPGHNFIEGLKICDKKKDFLVKPLQSNPQSQFLKKGRIDRLCEKYQLNRNFYEKKGKEAAICDNEMKDFLKRRASLRKAIDEKKHTEIESVKVPRQYTNIPSRAFSTISHLSSKSLPKVSSQRLIGDCQDYLRKRERIKNKNEFQILQNKIDAEQDVLQDEQSKDKLQRYTGNYLRLITSGAKSVTKMGYYQKSLLKDELRLKKLFNYQK